MFAKIWDYILWFVLIVEALLIIAFFVPRIFGFKPFVVTSGSMTVKYPVGSIIYVKKVNADEINIGDAITFYMKNSQIVATHDVYNIDKEANKYYTQGLSNLDDSGNIIHDAEPVRFSEIIGKPVFSIPYIGYANMLINNSKGATILIIATLILIGVSFLLDKKKGV